MSYENLGHYGWHGMADGSDEADHEAEAQAGLERAHELLEAAHDAALDEPIALDAEPEAGMHMLILDEVLYAADRGLLSEEDVHRLIDAKPADLELVLSGEPHGAIVSRGPRGPDHERSEGETPDRRRPAGATRQRILTVQPVSWLEWTRIFDLRQRRLEHGRTDPRTRIRLRDGTGRLLPFEHPRHRPRGRRQRLGAKISRTAASRQSSKALRTQSSR